MHYFKRFADIINESASLDEATKKLTAKELAYKKMSPAEKKEQDFLNTKISFTKGGPEVQISTALRYKDKDGKFETPDKKKFYDKAAKEYLAFKSKNKTSISTKEKPVAQKEVPQAKSKTSQTKPQQDASIAHVKNKVLQKGEPNKTEVFKAPVDMNDKDFETLNKGVLNPSTIKRFKFSNIKALSDPRFPKKYTTLIERMVNTNRSNPTEKLGWKNFSKAGGGAGDISAQGGEILCLMGTSMDDASSKQFFDQLRQHVKEVKAKGLKPTIDETWVDASEKQRAAILKRISKQYPKGTKIIGTSWDTKDEVESMGLSEYGKNKGFSTDIYLKLQTSDGKQVLDEVSLKKSLVINLLNSGTGKFKDWDKNIPDNINANVYAKNQFLRNRDFVNKNKAAIIKAASTDKKLKDLLANKKVNISDIFAETRISTVTKKNIPARDYSNILYMCVQAMANNKNKTAQGLIDTTNKAHKDFVEDAYKALISNKKLKSGLLDEVKNEFPLKAIAEGEESMALGEHSLDKITLKAIFGTSDFNEIRENLVVKTGKDGKSYLAYEAIKGKNTIPIADINIYEDGKGYGGQFKFAMVLNNLFAKKIKEVNSSVYSNQNENIFLNYEGFLLEKNN